jgi:hypothetical protein
MSASINFWDLFGQFSSYNAELTYPSRPRKNHFFTQAVPKRLKISIKFFILKQTMLTKKLVKIFVDIGHIPQKIPIINWLPGMIFTVFRLRFSRWGLYEEFPH